MSYSQYSWFPKRTWIPYKDLNGAERILHPGFTVALLCMLLTVAHMNSTCLEPFKYATLGPNNLDNSPAGSYLVYLFLFARLFRTSLHTFGVQV